jgi:amidohydrolase family protein
MRKLGISFVLGLVAVVSAVQTPAQSAVPVTLIKAGRLLDPRTGNILAPAAVLIEDGKIKEVGSPSQVLGHAPAGVKTIDLGSATLLPGLIDSHTHLLMDITLPTEAERRRRYNGDYVPAQILAIVESPSKRVLLGAQMAREDLESGITTVRNVEAERAPGVVWELYLGLPANSIPNPESPFFVGTMALFSAGVRGPAHKEFKPAHFTFNANRAIAASLERNRAELSLVFVPSGPLVNGKPSRPQVKSPVRIGTVDLSVGIPKEREVEKE